MCNRAQTSKRQPSTNTGQHKPFRQRRKKFQGQKFLTANQIPGFQKIKIWTNEIICMCRG